jgi:hypothetical protein
MVIGAHERSGQPPHFIYSLCVAATNNPAQDRIGERGRHRLAVGEKYGFRQNGLDARQAITLAGSIDVGGTGSAVLRRPRPDQTGADVRTADGMHALPPGGGRA